MRVRFPPALSPTGSASRANPQTRVSTTETRFFCIFIKSPLWTKSPPQRGLTNPRFGEPYLSRFFRGDTAIAAVFSSFSSSFPPTQSHQSANTSYAHGEPKRFMTIRTVVLVWNLRTLNFHALLIPLNHEKLSSLSRPLLPYINYW